MVTLNNTCKLKKKCQNTNHLSLLAFTSAACFKPQKKKKKREEKKIPKTERQATNDKTQYYRLNFILIHQVFFF